MKKSSRTKTYHLAEKLRLIRLQLSLSQNEILERLGFAEELFRSNVSQYERGKRVPPLQVLLRYAQIANVWLDALVDDELDLPEKLPSARKHEGVTRKESKRRNKK
jgi:transcriptional regulator with XRE-family HTH domain